MLSCFFKRRKSGLICAAFSLLLISFAAIRAERLPIKHLTIADGLPQNSINKIAQDASGFFWFCTSGGLARFDGYNFTNFTVREGLPHDKVLDFLAAREGDYWLATVGGLVGFEPDGAAYNRVVTFDEAGGLSEIPLFTTYSLPDGKDKYPTKLMQDSQGRIWVGSSNGLFRLEKLDEQFNKRQLIQINLPPAAVAEYIYSLYEDRRGAIWVGAETALYRILPDGRVTSYAASRAEGEPQPLFKALLEDSHGNFWVGTSNQDWKIGRFDGKNFTWLRPALLRDFDYMGWNENQLNFQARNGEWWITTGEGLFRYPKTDFEKLPTTAPLTIFDKTSGLAPHDVFRLYEDSRGDVWISTSGEKGNGFFVWRRDSEILQNAGQTENLSSQLKKDMVSSFAEDGNGNLWIAFYYGGVARISPATGETQIFDDPEGVPKSGINHIFVSRTGDIWLATGRGGLLRVDDAQSSNPNFVKFTTTNGLSSNRTFAVTEDRQGLIYVTTDRDVNRLNPATGEVKSLTLSDEMPPREFRTAMCDARGTLWFGTTAGLVKYEPFADELSKPPKILLTKIEIEGITQKVSAIGAIEINLPPLAPEQNQLRIDFVSLAALDDKDVRYQYKIDSQADWSPPSKERFVNFAGLSFGDYKIEFRAVAGGNLTSELPAIVTFKILPPFYFRAWFLFLAALTFAAAIYGFYRFRLNNLLGIERTRTRIATDLHDDIGANLSKISILSEIFKMQFAGGSEENNRLLDSIADASRESVASMSDIVWAINPERDSVLDMIHRMRHFAEETLSQKAIQFVFNAPENSAQSKLSMDTRRELFLIFKESINNAVKYADCSRVEVDFRVAGSEIFLEIADDGSGFDTAGASVGNGLTNMKSRAEKLSGKFEIVSEIGEGTIVKVRIPQI